MSDAPVTPLNPSIEPQTPDFRQVPHNIEAEQGLLGALLINNDALDQVAEFLKPAYFHDPVHQRIFEAISKLVGNGNLASPVTLKT